MKARFPLALPRKLWTGTDTGPATSRSLAHRESAHVRLRVDRQPAVLKQPESTNEALSVNICDGRSIMPPRIPRTPLYNPRPRVTSGDQTYRTPIEYIKFSPTRSAPLSNPSCWEFWFSCLAFGSSCLSAPSHRTFKCRRECSRSYCDA